MPEGIYRLILPFTQKLQNGKTIEQEKSAAFEWVENRLHFVDWDFLRTQQDGELNEETKDELNKIFKNGNKNTIYDYFTSSYSSPDKMNFVEFLKYYPDFDDNNVWTPEMKEKFENSEYWSPYKKDGWTLDDFPEGPSFYEPAKINESLAYYAGITTDDIRANYTEKKWNTFYVKEIDRYVVFRDGWTAAEFVVEEGKKSGDTVILTGRTITFGPLQTGEVRGFGTSVLTLKEKDGRYLIQSLEAK